MRAAKRNATTTTNTRRPATHKHAPRLGSTKSNGGDSDGRDDGDDADWAAHDDGGTRRTDTTRFSTHGDKHTLRVAFAPHSPRTEWRTRPRPASVEPPVVGYRRTALFAALSQQGFRRPLLRNRGDIAHGRRSQSVDSLWRGRSRCYPSVSCACVRASSKRAALVTRPRSTRIQRQHATATSTQR